MQSERAAASPTFAAWQALLAGEISSDSSTYHAAWLQILVQGLGGVSQAVLVLDSRWLGEAPGEWVPAATWPLPRLSGGELPQLLEQSLAMDSVLQRQVGERLLVAMPVSRRELDANGLASVRSEGVVALEFAHAGAKPAWMLEWVRWGSAWLWSSKEQGALSSQPFHVPVDVRAGEDALRERMWTALDVLIAVLGARSFPASSIHAVNELAHRLGCDRVSLGFGKGRRVRLQAMSQAADFSRRTDLAQAVEAAMDEASDQGRALVVKLRAESQETGEAAASPDASGLDGAVALEHQRLMKAFDTDLAVSVPFADPVQGYGVLTFEWRGQAPSADLLAMAEGIPAIVGRLLLEKRHAARPWWRRAADRVVAELREWLGPRHALAKLAGMAAVAAVVAVCLIHAPYRISAGAQLEGEVRRMVASPFDGFVAQAKVKAGDVVQEGELMALLDDRDLRLESEKWASQQHQYARQAQEAQAQHSLAQIQISMAQIAQAASQRRLSEAQAARSQIRAPLAGLIVSGDLSQSLGSAVKKGQSLFEISPLDRYRVVLQVDESDIDQVTAGQRGELMLTALPGQRLPFTVKRVTPVAKAQDGHNQFRVEAVLSPDAVRQAQLRPGMEGIGKVELGERRLIWIWTHRMNDWLRLQAWSWLGW